MANCILASCDSSLNDTVD